MAQLDPQAFAPLARAMSTLTNGNPAQARVDNADNSAPDSARSSTAQTTISSAPNRVANVTVAQSDSFHATNAAAVQGVIKAIETQVDHYFRREFRNRLATGWLAKFIANWIRLQANRAWGKQMRDAFRSGGVDDAHRQAIVSLATARARQALPGVAKRVLNEWTNTIVSARDIDYV